MKPKRVSCLTLQKQKRTSLPSSPTPLSANLNPIQWLDQQVSGQGIFLPFLWFSCPSNDFLALSNNLLALGSKWRGGSVVRSVALYIINLTLPLILLWSARGDAWYVADDYLDRFQPLSICFQLSWQPGELIVGQNKESLPRLLMRGFERQDFLLSLDRHWLDERSLDLTQWKCVKMKYISIKSSSTAKRRRSVMWQTIQIPAFKELPFWKMATVGQFLAISNMIHWGPWEAE